MRNGKIHCQRAGTTISTQVLAAFELSLKKRGIFLLMDENIGFLAKYSLTDTSHFHVLTGLAIDEDLAEVTEGMYTNRPRQLWEFVVTGERLTFFFSFFPFKKCLFP